MSPRRTACTSRRGTWCTTPPTRTDTRSGAVAFQFARLLRVFDRDILRFGTAISTVLSGPRVARLPIVFAFELLHSTLGIQYSVRAGPKRV